MDKKSAKKRKSIDSNGKDNAAKRPKQSLKSSEQSKSSFQKKVPLSKKPAVSKNGKGPMKKGPAGGGSASESDKEQRPPKVRLNKIDARKKQKELKLARRQKKGTPEVFQLSVEAKKIWEKARKEDQPKSEQIRLVTELYEHVKGNISQIAYAHDTSRVVECLVALGDDSIRSNVFKEVQDDLFQLMKSNYATFFVQKLIKYGSKEQRSAIMKRLEGMVPRLARHKVANLCLELCYNDFSNAVQRNHLIQEFFGPEFRHFKSDTASNVLQIFKERPEKIKSVTMSLQENCNILITKGCYNISLVHTIFYNYMLALNHQGQTKQRTDFISQLRDVCVHVLHSHDGSRLAMNAFWHGNAKDRKALIKSFKGHILKIATEEHGHFVLMALFDCVDDTKLVIKAVVDELGRDLDAVMANKFGRSVLMYLIAPRNPVFFYSGTVQMLAAGDGNEHSKKDVAQRQLELKEPAAKYLLPYLSDHWKTLVKDGGASVIMLQEVLKSLMLSSIETDHVTKLLESLADATAKSFDASSDAANEEDDDDEEEQEEKQKGASLNLVEDSASHRMLKKLINLDKGDKPVSVSFSKLLASRLTAIDDFVRCNRGCFILVALLETQLPEITSKLTPMLKKASSILKQQKTVGAEILLKKLA